VQLPDRGRTTADRAPDPPADRGLTQAVSTVSGVSPPLLSTPATGPRGLGEKGREYAPKRGQLPSGRRCIPRKSDEWRSLYRRRSAVEREFGRLKHHYALAMLRVRGIERVRLHADLTILGRPALELARARAIPIAA
jgi:hypothetical protein